MSSIFPLVYQFMSVSNNQFNNVLEFCEDSALTVMEDSALILNKYSKLEAQKRIEGLANQTNNPVRIFMRADFTMGLIS